jgi:crotonobetainyl-CoA:carnitine CoA-transferase CaiB-like acyl-CoA transferase
VTPGQGRSGDKPLAGIRVIDLTDDCGELCGRFLADLGADVILVEPPSGADARKAPPLAPGGRSSLYFAFRNAGKRGISLDLESPDDRELLHRLLDDSDILIESYRPGFLANCGLDPARVLLERHPHLVVTSITDFGQFGPHRDFAGTDMIGYAMGGMMYRAGAAERPPVVAPGCQAYDTAALTAAFATLVAYVKRLETGRGQWLDVSVQEATLTLSDWSIPLYSTLGFYTHREGAGMWPVYRCADGWLRMIIIGLNHWQALRAWMGEPEELQNPAYDGFIGRLGDREKIDAFIRRFLSDRKKDDAAREAQRRGIPATPVLEPAEVLDNEHTRGRGTFVELELVPGTHAAVASGFIVLDGDRFGPTARAPLLGEHNEEVRASLGSRGEATKAAVRWSLGRQAAYPLAGLRALDFGIGVAGVEVGRLLAEYGVEVIKIESSTAPDFVRMVIPGPMNAPFASSNHSKLSFGVNLKTEAGVGLVHRLARQADFVIENSATGVMDRLGLGYETLKEINPRIIMFSTQMAGASGPWKDWSGYGPSAHTLSGLQYLWNYPEDADRPAGSTNIHPDHLTGKIGAAAVLAALIRRERNGRGARVEVAQFEVLIQLLGDLLVQESLAPGSVQPQGNCSERGVPWGAYWCQGEDEWCVINVRSDAEWAALRQALGNPEWASAARYSSVAGRREAWREIDKAIDAWTRQRLPVEVMQLLQKHGVPAGVVQHPGHQFCDPHLEARGFLRRFNQRHLGEVTLEGAPFHGSDLPEPRIESAPLLGQHTREICRSLLGLTDPEIDALLEAGVLEETPPTSK